MRLLIGLVLHVAIGVAMILAYVGLFAGAWKLVESGVTSATAAGGSLLAIVLAAIAFLASRTRHNVPRL